MKHVSLLGFLLVLQPMKNDKFPKDETEAYFTCCSRLKTPFDFVLLSTFLPPRMMFLLLLLAFGVVI
jgi:hypothetical protein